MSSHRDPAPQADGHVPPPEPKKAPPRRKWLRPWLSLLGLAALSYVVGAAAMFFELPSSDFLAKSFIGAQAWYERSQVPARDPDRETPRLAAGAIDRPGKTFDGFTLYTCNTLKASSTQAFLIDMRREVVHRWSIPFSQIWPNPPHVRGRVRDALVGFFSCYLYPNGDLLVVLHGLEQLANGYGLVKLDKDSNVLWKYAANIHHDVDVGEDGTIYALQHDMVRKMPEGLGFIPVPCLVDSLVLLSPEGERRNEPISILEALRGSPYAALLASLEKPSAEGPRPGHLTRTRFDEAARRQDVLHTNFVQVLPRALAPKFPAFKAGQVLFSMRHLDAIAVLDLERRSVVWAAHGPWLEQHDPQFLDNGHLLIFDNLGMPAGSRVLEYDPQTQALPWTYAGENRGHFLSSERGMSQRLPNGNTLVVNSEGGEIFEVTHDKEVVWSCPLEERYVASARRYAPAQVPFLKGGQRARP